jgi:hypothetical protein
MDEEGFPYTQLKVMHHVHNEHQVKIKPNCGQSVQERILKFLTSAGVENVRERITWFGTKDIGLSKSSTAAEATPRFLS